MSALVLVLSYGAVSVAETIYLKDGRKVEAKVTKRTKDSITIDWYGVPVTYWMDEVDHVVEAGGNVTQLSQGLSNAQPPAAVPPRAGADAAHDALIEQVIKKAGLTQRIEQLQVMMSAQLNQRQQAVTPEVYATLRKAMTDAYQPDALRPLVVDTFRRDFHQEKLSQVLEWLNSPLARNMSRLVDEAKTPQGLRAMEEFMAQLQHAPIPHE